MNDQETEDNAETVDPPATEAEAEGTDFFADLMLGRDGVAEGVITHW